MISELERVRTRSGNVVGVKSVNRQLILFDGYSWR